MTPKEKAHKLIDSYLISFFGVIQEYLPVQYKFAKQCVLIAIDEIIEVAYWNSVKEFYKEVKKEIENN